MDAAIVRIAEQALSPLESSLKAGPVLATEVRRAQSLPDRRRRGRAVQIAKHERFAVRRPTLLQKIRRRPARLHRPPMRDLMREARGWAEYPFVEARHVVTRDDGVVHAHGETCTLYKAALDSEEIPRRCLRLAEAGCEQTVLPRDERGERIMRETELRREQCLEP